MGLANTSRLTEMLRQFGLADDPVYHQDLMRIHVAFQVAKYTSQPAMDKIKRGELPGPELSIAKLALTSNMTAVAEFVSRVLGPRLRADTGEWGTHSWNQFSLGTPAMRNIVGERVLGLPKDPGIDTTTPFRDLRVGTQPQG